MTKFKCDKCGCNPEELWFFGGFGPASQDNKEYCEPCFSKRVEFFELRTPKQEESQELEEIENSLIA
jgi:hypothetical protein